MSDIKAKIILDRQLIAERDYWVERLRQVSESANLWLDFPRPAQATTERAVVPLTITGELYHTLVKMTGGSSFLLYAILMATVKLYLYKYTGNATISIGSPSRRADQQLDCVGNALPIIDQVDEARSFRQWLLQVRQTLLDAYEHQHYPTDRLIFDLGWEPVSNKHALFDMAVVLPAIHDELPTLPNDITLVFHQQSAAVTGEIFYNPTLFRPESIERFAKGLLHLLASALTDTNQPLAALSLLTPQERQQQLVEWNNTRTPYPSDKTIAQLFEEQVAQTPDALAVIFDQGSDFTPVQLTYRQLNQRANQLAHQLRTLGVEAETLVGICVERSLEMVVGLLAILKAGGAYVPLDPGYPPERLAFMLEDTRAPILLTQAHLAANFNHVAATVITLATDGTQFADQPASNLPVLMTSERLAAETLAYVMYTSGSTGVPKGVAVCQRNVVRLVKNTNYLPFTPAERFLQSSPISFDAATFELWGALLNGAQLVVMPPQQPSLAAFGNLLTRHKITALFLTTALFNLMVDEQLPALMHVHYILTGGEVMSLSHFRKVLAWPGHSRLMNFYGPTENTTYSTFYPIEDASQIVNSVPIGRPIANTQLYVLDRHLQPLPIGAPGELYVGGDGVARGYLNRPALTQEKFIANPFACSDDVGGKTEQLYKTGDLVRYLPDGNVEFIGRIDQQVKLRGFRIELGEIEAVLSQHPQVRQSVVIVHQDQVGEKRLVAYVVAGCGVEDAGGKLQVATCILEPATLRDFLQAKLPEYMIPAAIMLLSALPLTPNGKIDKRVLPAPEWHEGTAASFVAARTPAEEQMAQIWAELLQQPQVGIHDNFFDIGGHSLLATQLLSRLTAAFAVDLPLITIFEQPTVAQLVETIETIRWTRRPTDEPGTNGTTNGATLPENADDVNLLELGVL